MALRDNPYIMLDVNDFMNDEKLRECSAAAVGIYIRLLCVLHKSETYGVLLYQQKDVQKAKICGYKNPNKIQIFVTMLSRQLPETREEIESALIELSEEGVIKIYDNRLEQKRMVRDAEISEKRQATEEAQAEICNNKTPNKNQNFVPTKPLTNSENLLDTCARANPSLIDNNINILEEDREEEKGVQGGKEKSAAHVESDKIALFVSLWNSRCKSLPQVHKLTPARRDKVRARLKDEPDLEVWEEIFCKIQNSTFCNGDNAHGWKASFDWITTNANNYVKVLEGNYDRDKRTQDAGPRPAGAGRVSAERGDYEDRL